MEGKFPINSLVWAKLSGYPWWPGYVKNETSPGEYEVEYFGDFSRSFLNYSKLKPFSASMGVRDKKNAALINSYEMALRIYKGESTIDAERQRADCSEIPVARSDRRNSQDPESHNSNELEDTLALKRIKSTPNYGIKTNPKKRSEIRVEKENNSSDEIFFDNSDPMSDTSGRNKKIKKRTNKNGNLGKPMNPLERSQSHHQLLTEKHNEADTPKVELVLEVDEKFSESPSELDQIKLIETKLKEILAILGQGTAAADDALEKLANVQELIAGEDHAVHLMYNTQIGSTLIQIQEKLAEMQHQDRRFKELNDKVIGIMKLIRRKIFVGFFKTTDFDQKVIYSSSEMENMINLRRPAVSGSRYVSEGDSVKRAANLSLQLNRSGSLKQTMNDPQKSKRVCKRLAKQLHNQNNAISLKGADCENMAARIEQEIKNLTKSVDEYDKRILEIDKRLREELPVWLSGPHFPKTATIKIKLDRIYAFLMSK